MSEERPIGGQWHLSIASDYPSNETTYETPASMYFSTPIQSSEEWASWWSGMKMKPMRWPKHWKRQVIQASCRDRLPRAYLHQSLPSIKLLACEMACIHMCSDAYLVVLIRG